MPTQQQDVHDVFADLIDHSPEMADDTNLRATALRFASIAADILGRIEDLEPRLDALVKKHNDHVHAENHRRQIAIEQRIAILEARSESDTVHNHHDILSRLDTLRDRLNALKKLELITRPDKPAETVIPPEEDPQS